MNAKNQAAVKKYSALKTEGASREEIGGQIKTDDPKLKPNEIKAILDAIFKADAPPIIPAAGANNNGADGNKPSGKKGDKAAAPASPNDALDLKQFDYKKLTGKMFEKYVALVGDREFKVIDEETGLEKGVTGQLLQNDQYDFILVKAQPILKPRFAGVEGTPYDYVGIKVLADEPIHTSRMSVKTALEMNAQISNAHSRAGHGKYYLLKQ